MKIVIVNAHSFHNLGDAAILKTMIASLKEEFFCPDIVVSSDTPEKDQAAYNDVRVVGIAYPWVNAPPILRFWISIFFHLKFCFYVLLRKYFRLSLRFKFVQADVAILINEIGSSDLVVSCGGGYLNSLGKLFSRLSLVFTGIVFNKPTVFYSQSVSDLSSVYHRWLVRYVINRSSLFVAREEQTVAYLKSIGVNQDKVCLYADSAFLQECVNSTESEKLLSVFEGRAVRRVGLTVTRWSFPGREKSKELFQNYVDALRMLTKFVTEELDADIYVFPQVTGPGSYSDDRKTASEIFLPLNNNRVHLIEQEYTPEQLKGMIGCMDIFIGTRMHSNIFALGASVPTVAIAYQDKTVGIMGELGLSEWLIDINFITSQILIEKISNLWDVREDVSDLLREKMPSIRLSAYTPSVLCRELVCGGLARDIGFKAEN